MNNSLIIGFGKRVKNTVIPALKMIDDSNIYVYSRNFEKIIINHHNYKSNFKISYIFNENVICGYKLNGNIIKLPEN